MGSSSEQKCNVNYLVDYVKEATIKKEDYNVGIYKFNMLDTGTEVRIRINDTDFDPGSLQINPVDPNTVIITATVGGQREILKVLAPGIITQAGQGTNTLLVKLITAAGI